MTWASNSSLSWSSPQTRRMVTQELPQFSALEAELFICWDTILVFPSSDMATIRRPIPLTRGKYIVSIRSTRAYMTMPPPRKSSIPFGIQKLKLANNGHSSYRNQWAKSKPGMELKRLSWSGPRQKSIWFDDLTVRTIEWCSNIFANTLKKTRYLFHVYRLDMNYWAFQKLDTRRAPKRISWWEVTIWKWLSPVQSD